MFDNAPLGFHDATLKFWYRFLDIQVLPYNIQVGSFYANLNIQLA